MAALCLFLAELLNLKINSTETVAYLDAIASTHPASILKTFHVKNYTLVAADKDNPFDYLKLDNSPLGFHFRTMVVSNHDFWKEIIRKNEKLEELWSKLKSKAPEQNCVVHRRPKQAIPYGTNPQLPRFKQQGIRLVGGGGDARMANPLNPSWSQSSKHRPKPPKFPPKPTHPLKPPKDAWKRAKVDGYPPPRWESEMCSKCKGLVTYYRCCLCGCKPFDPRMYSWDDYPVLDEYDYEDGQRPRIPNPYADEQSSGSDDENLYYYT